MKWNYYAYSFLLHTSKISHIAKEFSLLIFFYEIMFKGYGKYHLTINFIALPSLKTLNFQFMSQIILQGSSLTTNLYSHFECFLGSGRGGIAGLKMNILKSCHAYCLTILWKGYIHFIF
jgi:hypothetical protein